MKKLLAMLVALAMVATFGIVSFACEENCADECPPECEESCEDCECSENGEGADDNECECGEECDCEECDCEENCECDVDGQGEETTATTADTDTTTAAATATAGGGDKTNVAGGGAKDAPATGVTGVAVFGALAALAAGTIVASKKK